MPFIRSESPGASPLARRSLVLMSAAFLLLSGPGCIVTTSSYEVKAREADALREALGSMNREMAKLAAENAALSAEVASCRKTEAALSGQAREKEEALLRLRDGTPAPPGATAADPVPREQFIDELLDREMAAGKRFQELNERTERCERELERMRRGAAAAGR